MPEYLAPGVYVEETTFRSKSIEGVPTSTTGFAGVTRYGPVQYIDGQRPGPRSTEPRLITSFTEFEQVYGGLEPIAVDRGDGQPTSEAYLAHAVRAFFLNGGKRLYVSRVFKPGPIETPVYGLASLQLAFGAGDNAIWRARWPGFYGNALLTVRPVRRRNSAFQHATFGTQATGLTRGAVVEITESPVSPAVLPADQADLVPDNLAVVDIDETVVDTAGQPRQVFQGTGGLVNPTPTMIIKEVVLRVTVQPAPDRLDVYEDLATHPAQRRWIGSVLEADDPEDENAVLFLDTPAPDDATTLTRAIGLMAALETPTQGVRLTGGNDGVMPFPEDLLGEAANVDDANVKATGLYALGEVDDIAIVALPDAGTYIDPTPCQVAAGYLIAHAEDLRYRIAVVDAPRGSSMTQVRDFRGKFDTTRGALYHPWIEILDPLQPSVQGVPLRRVLLPPSGFVTGIYARNDITRGVYKAPANEVVQGLTRFEANINKPRNDVLNPEGINALRFFEGRGNRVWGARTMSSDPEWIYVNVRRLFIYLERSIDVSMQYAVFEPNNPRLWDSIRRTVEDFLYVQWLAGALLGATPEEAYFVRCDRTTMTQNDLDNGRLICLIGVAPTKPAEFVIFRIGQFTADAR
ncbi:MAG: phage tail sheath subtilisin-like domain-containing protein [Pseudonocardiaceae bacterium]